MTDQTATTPARPIDLFGLTALIGGACAMGVSPLFVRFAADAGVPAFASAFWRVALALPVLWLWARAEEKRAGKGSRPTMTRAIALDATCLRHKCEQDPALGYEILKRFSHHVSHTLDATILQLMDVYALH